MRLLRDHPIRRKLSVVILLTSTLALLMASVAFTAYVYTQSRRSMAQSVRSLSGILSANSAAALVFDDQDAAGELLDSLQANPWIEKAVLFKDGRPFAIYPRNAVAPQPTGSVGAARFDRTVLIYEEEVALDGEPVGRLHLEHSLEPLHAQIRLYLAITLAVFLGSLLLVAWLSGLLRKVITEPLLRLAKTADEVAATKDYSLRAAAGNRDEIGTLIERFNQMLGQVQQRDRALERAREELEDRVRERTAELEGEVRERRKVEMELRFFTQDLERSNRDLQDFAYVASHDLQEPLRKIQAFGDRLRTTSAAKLDERALDYLDRMQGAAARMRALITDLLTFSRVATQGQPFEALDLQSVVDEIVRDLEIPIEESGAVVEYRDLPTIQADPLQLRQLLQNLISNALKFQRDDVRPRVTIRCETVGEPGVPDAIHRLIVEDNGIGIESRHFDRIFGVFQRLHGRGAYPGSGMGLSICRRIVERHGGSIRVESEPGEGSRFIAELPTDPDGMGAEVRESVING